MKLTTLLTALLSLVISTALAAPTTYQGEELHEMSLNEANVLTKRYSCCSGGLAVNCGNCSTNGSGRVCCGNCCKQYTRELLCDGLLSSLWEQ